MEPAGITVTKIAKEIRLHVPFREEFLIATKTGLAGCEEFLIHLRVIETGHRPAIEPLGAQGQDEIGALQ